MLLKLKVTAMQRTKACRGLKKSNSVIAFLWTWEAWAINKRNYTFPFAKRNWISLVLLRAGSKIKIAGVPKSWLMASAGKLNWIAGVYVFCVLVVAWEELSARKTLSPRVIYFSRLRVLTSWSLETSIQKDWVVVVKWRKKWSTKALVGY